MAKTTAGSRSDGRKTARTKAEALTVRAASVVLTKEDQLVVAGIVAAVDEWIDDVEDGLRTILAKVRLEVFGDDARAMLKADRAANPRFALLMERLAGRERLTDRHMAQLCRVFAYDALVKGRYWKKLLLGVKLKLLPLVAKDPLAPASFKTLNEAAKHAIDFDLDAEGAEQYVRAQLRLAGEQPRRNAGRKTYDRQVDRTIDLIGTDDGLERLVQVADKLDDKARAALQKKLLALAEAAAAAEKRLRTR